MGSVPNSPVSWCPQICLCEDKNTAWCSEIPKNLPNFTNTLKRLRLSNANLGPTFSYVFEEFFQLEFLDLSGNKIYLLEGQILKELPDLKVLILHNNLLSTLAPHLFETNTKLEHLDLSKNKFAGLPDHAMKYLTNLKTFNISYNILSRPALTLRFQETKVLQVLDYSNNPFQSFPEDTFLYAHQWDHQYGRHVNFSNCNINHLSPNVFKNFPHLVSLSLSHNPLIHKRNLSALLSNLQMVTTLKRLDLSWLRHNRIVLFFANLEHITISELDLSGNNIVDIAENALQYLSTLKTFYLRKNKLTTPNGLGRLSNLEYLDISYNKLAELKKPLIQKLPKLQHFVAHHNKLNTITINDLSKWKNLKYLDISYNHLETLNLPLLPKLEILNISNNRLRSLLFPVGIMSLRIIDASNNRLASMVPFQFSGMRQIHTVNFSNNHIAMIHGQTFRGFTPKIIDLSQNKMTKLGHYGWENATEVYFSQNQIQYVHMQSFYHMFSLEVLDLHDNQIETIEHGTFRHLKNLTTLLLSRNNFGSNTNFNNIFTSLSDLQYLDLSSNCLTSLSNTSLRRSPHLKTILLSSNNLTSISPIMFVDITHLEQIDLSDNPYICDCRLIPLRDWLRSTTVQLLNNTSHAHICTSPSFRSGLPIWKFEVTKFECHKNLLYLTIFGSVTLLVLVVITILASARYIQEKCGHSHLGVGGIPEFKTLNHYKVDWVNSKDQINPLLVGNAKKQTQPSQVEKPKERTQQTQAGTTRINKDGERENIYVNCLEFQNLRRNLNVKPAQRSMTPDPSLEHRHAPSNLQRRYSLPGSESCIYRQTHQHSNGRYRNYRPEEKSGTMMKRYNSYNTPDDFGYSGLHSVNPSSRNPYPSIPRSERYWLRHREPVHMHRPLKAYSSTGQYFQRQLHPRRYLDERCQAWVRTGYVTVPSKKSCVAQWL